MLFKKRIALAIERERRDQRRKAQAFQRRYVALLPKDPIKPEDKR
jgi:hypothetical protein